MPLNKQALVRYRIIDRCLRDKRSPFPSLETLQDKLEEFLSMSISESTVEKDIRAMRTDPELGFNAPIKYSKKYKGYHYTDDKFTIANVPLSDEDINAIEFAAITLRQFEDIPLFNDFGGTVDKIFQAINIGTALDFEELRQIIQFEKSPKMQGIEHLETLLQCIKEGMPIRFEYLKFGLNESKAHLVHPYLVKEYRNRWYLIGRQDSNDLITTYALDRMEFPEPSNEVVFKKPLDFDSGAYFKHSFGITTFEGEPEEVILSFDPFQGRYVQTQKLHETQEEIPGDGNDYRIRLTVGVTIELEMAILSYGEKVRVIKPESLRNKIQERLKDALDKY